MIFSIDETSEKMVATIPGPLGAESFDLSLLICEDPRCMCDSLTMTLTAQDESHSTKADSLTMTVNLQKQEVEFSQKSPGLKREQLYFEEKMQHLLQAEDYQFLNDAYLGHKRVMTEQADMSKLEVKFRHHEIENESELVHYTQVLPYGENFTISEGDQKYIILDYYCLKTACQCTDATLAFIPFRDREIVEDNSLTFCTNYKTHRWKVYNASSSGPNPNQHMKTLKNVIESAYTDFYKKLKKRHDDLKRLYASFLQREGLTVQQARTKSVGRNSPCPCGSGKKYKKCCLGKSE